MEQQYGYSGNPNLPMFNNSGAGGQQYGYGRYQPPMMTGFNNQQWLGYGSPYSYNTPNSYGSNFGGGNFYTPYGSSAYGGQSPMQNPLPMFGRGGFPGFSNSQGGMPGGSGMAYGNGQGYQPSMPQWGTKPWNEPMSPYGGSNMDAMKFPYNTKPYQDVGGGNSLPNWAQDPYRGMSGGRYGRQAANPDAPAPVYSAGFEQFLGMGY